jgi:ERF superfamily
MTETAPAAPRRRRANGQHPAPMPAPVPPALPAAPQPSTLMQAIIAASADPAVDVGKIGELVKLHQDLQVREWQRAFNGAMTLCQTELQPVAKNQSNASTNSRYADLARLAESALPIVHKHGFALTFGEVDTPKPNHIGVAVRISHRDGHAERAEFHVPLDLCGFKGTPNKTAIHGWGSALTYCRRYALLCAFNVIVSGDDDGNAAGKPKSSAQLKREGVWPTFQAEMRGAKSLRDLQAVVERWRPRVVNWSLKWKGAAEELHGQCFERLGGTLQALKDSSARLETPAPPPHWEG